MSKPQQTLSIQQAIDLAVQHHNEGRLSQAENIYQQILEKNPNQPVALHLLGVIAHQMGKNDRAVDLISQALAIRPDFAAAHSNLGLALQDLGELEEAEASYHKALALKPDYAEAHNNLGNALKDLGKLEDAVASYQKALDIRPDYAEAHFNVGNLFQELGKLDDAANGYRRALAINPDYAEANSNLGNALHDLGKPEEAVASYRKALALKPDYAEAHNNLGVVLQDLGELEEAVVRYHKALDLSPDYAEAHYNLGNALHDLGKPEEAVAGYRKALTIKPYYAEAHSNLSNALRALGRLDEAVTHCKKALSLKPDFAEAHNNLGNALQDLGRLEEAIASYQKALGIKPDLAEAHGNLLFGLHYSPDVTLADLLRENKAWNDRHAALIRPAPLRVQSDPEQRPLTVGLLSKNFRRHPALWLSLPGLEALDPGIVQLIAYSDINPVNEDDLTDRLRRVCRAWRDIGHLDDAAVAEQIRADNVNVLLDMSGHGGSRVLVCAHRAAPVQVKWVGNQFGTTGVTAMDWFLGDIEEVPAGHERWYVEDVYRMPDAYAVYHPPVNAPAVSPLPTLDKGCVTFGCFNKPIKMTPEIIAVWADILRAVPDSRLFLKGKAFNSPEPINRFRRLFLDRDVDPDLLIFEGSSPHTTLLECYNRVDISLDPWPYSGCVTTLESLWMGVPVLSRPGPGFTGRHSASFLRTVGLDDWLVDDFGTYVDKAVWWANHLDDLAVLRGSMRDRVAASPQCDGPRFARNLEAALDHMWRAACKQTVEEDAAVSMKA